MVHFPFLANIEGIRWLIAGGGSVALRKVRGLFPYGTVIEVISPDMSPGLDKMVQDIAYTDTLKLIRRELEDRDLDRADSVITITSEPGLNNRISVLCRSKRIPVNMADVKEKYSPILPSIVQDGPAVARVSIGGMGPAIARRLRVRIRSVMPDSLGEPTARLGAYRETVKDLLPDSSRVRSALSYKLAEEGLSHSGCLTREQT